ncbi:MAG: hypothetical protein AAF639_17980 [Chloroflexota bacterium]
MMACPLAALGLLFVPALQDPGPLDFLAAADAPWPNDVQDAVLLSGDFVGNGFTDVITFTPSTGAGVLLHSPALWDVQVALPDPVDDLTVFPNLGASSPVSPLSASAAGVVLWHWDPEGSWEENLVPGSWSSPRRVATHHVPGAGVVFVSVLDADMRTVTTQLHLPDDANFFYSVHAFTFGEAIESLTLTDLTGDGHPELGVELAAGGFQVLGLDGSVVQPGGSGPATRRVEVLATPEGEAFAWMSFLSPTFHHVHSVSESTTVGPEVLFPYALGAVDAVDLNQDGRTDLVGIAPDSSVVFLLPQGPGTPNFDPLTAVPNDSECD